MPMQDILKNGGGSYVDENGKIWSYNIIGLPDGGSSSKSSSSFILSILPAILLGLLILAFIIAFIYFIHTAKKTAKNKHHVYVSSNYAPIEEVYNATVLSSIQSPHPTDSFVMMSVLIFQKTTGERLTFSIDDSEKYKSYTKGDIGTLCHKGEKFISFTKN